MKELPPAAHFYVSIDTFGHPVLQFADIVPGCGQDHLLPMNQLEAFIQPLLQFRPDPRRQLWCWNANTNQLMYLGEFDKEINIQVPGLYVLSPSDALRWIVTANQRVGQQSVQPAATEVKLNPPCFQTYVAEFTVSNRAYGSTPGFNRDIVATSLEEAMVLARAVVSEQPDIYATKVSLKDAPPASSV